MEKKDEVLDSDKPSADKPKTTQMVAQNPAAVRMVRVRLNRDAVINDKGEVGIPGQTVDVTEARAKELCDVGFTGNFAFTGERYEDRQAPKIFRAVRLAS